MTLSDISLAAGRLDGFGDPTLVDSLDPSLVGDAVGLGRRAAHDHERADEVEPGSRSRCWPSAVAPTSCRSRIEGISDVLRPENHSVANAYGAGIAEASGTVDRVYSYDDGGRDSCLDDARQMATDAAVPSRGRPGPGPDHRP